MKSAVFTLLLMVGLAGSAAAQKQDRHAELPGTGEPTQARVDELTRQMCNSLRLNEAQYIRLRSANQIKLARQEEISWQYKDNIAEQRAKLSELESQYEAECGRILTPSQLSLFHAEQQRDMPLTTDPLEGGLG
ncbi:hypothetical protein [Hymenobacter psychrotolerans]|uniref:LTXXQ motif family protein n=1 Tax=Hymenobacter psychrotolerans DSM 18569 TaxID=1121959 RepID=A0A1M6SJT9_9BACT|nr:hypothetical protein [Hymenobacter psychrotolerans]SHK44975.1 hypothetical protein SAMN02746009_00898 [Hymenobacter psychrotolerans DSM 18569]